MSPELMFVIGLVLMVAIFLASFVAMLAFRNPYRAAWFNHGYADNVVVVSLLAAAVFDLSWVLKTLVGLGVDPAVAMVVEAATAILAASVLWRKLHMRERLDAAQNGMSPFAELRHIRHRSRNTPGMGGGAVGAA